MTACSSDWLERPFREVAGSSPAGAERRGARTMALRAFAAAFLEEES